jgi:transposase
MDSSRLGQRMLVVELRKRGLSSLDIERDYGYTRAFTDRWWGRFTRGEGFDDLPREGRLQKLPEAVTKKLKRKLKRKIGGTTRRVAAEMLAETGISVSHQTILRAAAKLGLKFRSRPKKPLLKDEHKARRLTFAALERPALFWHGVFFTDEKTYGILYYQRGQWLEFNDEPEPCGTEKYGVSVRVWGGVGCRGLTPLYRISKSMTAPEYRHFLQTKVYPDMEEKYGKDWIFQHDGDGSHSANQVRAWLDEQEEEWLSDWPSRSPDLSPIENLWSIIGQRLVGAKLSTADGLWRRLKLEWESIDQSIYRNLGGSMLQRLQLVIASAGAAIKY